MTTRQREPRFGAVVLEQVRVTGFAVRIGAAIAAMVAALGTLMALPNIIGGIPLSINGWPTWLPGIMGTFLPLAVWGKDKRFGPDFLWTLPVDRRRHALAKIIAGWIWLVAAVILFLVWLYVMTRATGESVLPHTLHLLTSGVLSSTVVVDPATLRTVSWDPGPLMWLVPFAGPTAAYMIGSAVMLGTRRPLRWVVGVAVLFAFTSVISEPVSTQLQVSWLNDAPGRFIQLVTESRYGLDSLFTARSEVLSATMKLTTGQSIRLWSAIPDLSDWGIAALLWLALGGVALMAAVSRHGERRRG